MTISGRALYKEVDKGYLPMTWGAVTLVAGVGTEVLAPEQANPHTPLASPIVTRMAPGGVIGDLSATWNQNTRTITITSANAGDISAVAFLLVG